MKSKTLLSMAVAGALSASVAYAGPNVSPWVAAGEEQYPAMIFGSESPSHVASIDTADAHASVSLGGTSSSVEGSVEGSFTSEMSSGSMSSLSTDESLALDDGVYSDFIIASVPVTVETWDIYLVPDESVDVIAFSDDASSFDTVAASDWDHDFMILPYDVVLIESYSPSSEDESLG